MSGRQRQPNRDCPGTVHAEHTYLVPSVGIQAVARRRQTSEALTPPVNRNTVTIDGAGTEVMAGEKGISQEWIYQEVVDNVPRARPRQRWGRVEVSPVGETSFGAEGRRWARYLSGENATPATGCLTVTGVEMRIATQV